MANKDRVFLLLINILPMGLVVILLMDMIEAIATPEKYYFGSDAMVGNAGYFYKSQVLYLSKSVFEILLFFVLIVSSFYGKWKLYYILLPIAIAIFFLPFITSFF